jgi:hypothetical protein
MTSAYLTDHRTTPYDFLATFYDQHFVSEAELGEAYDDWCEVHDLATGTGADRDRNMRAWAASFMDQLTDEDWLPNAISEHAMEHWNLLIALAQTDWQLGGEQLRTSQQALDEYAGIIVFEDAELGDEAPLRVQFGYYSTSPVFITDTYDIADVWNALGMSFPAAKYTPSSKEN